MGLLQASRCDPGRRGVSFPQGQRLSAGQEGLTAFALLAVGAGVGWTSRLLCRTAMCADIVGTIWPRPKASRIQRVQELTRQWWHSGLVIVCLTSPPQSEHS